MVLVGYAFDNPKYGYGNINNPVRTSWSGGVGVVGASSSYYPKRKLFDFGPTKSENINLTFINISNDYSYGGLLKEQKYYINFGFDLSAIIGISWNLQLGYKQKK